MQIPHTKQNEKAQEPGHGPESKRPGIPGVAVITSCFFAALLLIGFRPANASGASSSANLPLVFGMENTSTKFPAPPLPELGNATYIQPLPDPFAWAKAPLGKGRSEKFSDWEHHRAEII